MLHKNVYEFHQAFGLSIVDPVDGPAIPTEDVVRKRARLIAEEFLEYLRATFDIYGGILDTALERIVKSAPLKVNLVETADAIADLSYVVEGANLEYGIDGAAVLAEVHRSNMAKRTRCPLCAGVGGAGDVACPDCDGAGYRINRRGDGKILKPAGWTPPDIAGVLARQTGGCASMVCENTTEGVGAATNVCEHGDHPAPEGARFCSTACQECEALPCGNDVECAGVCESK